MIASSGRPSRWSTVTGASSGTSAPSLMSDSTRWLWTWATSSGPRSPAALGREPVAVDQPHAERRAGRRRGAPTPGRGTTGPGAPHLDVDPRPSARTSRSTVRSSTARRAGHGVQHLAVLDRGGDQRVDDAAVDLVEGVGGLVEVVERGRLADHRCGGVAGRAHEAVRRSRSMASRVPAVTRSGPAGPSPTTTMRAAIRAQDDAGTLSVVAGVGPFGGSTVPVERFHRPYWGFTDTSAFVSSSSTASCSFCCVICCCRRPVTSSSVPARRSSTWMTNWPALRRERPEDHALFGLDDLGGDHHRRVALRVGVELGPLHRADRVLEGLAARHPDLDLRHHALVGHRGGAVALHLELVGIVGLQLLVELADGFLRRHAALVIAAE